MFRDDAQRLRVARALLERVDLAHYFNEYGPTDFALSQLATAPLSSGELTLLRAAFDVWNGHGQLVFGRLMALDAPSLRAIGSLLVALGTSSDAIDAWLATEEARAKRSPEEKLAADIAELGGGSCP